MKIGFDPGFDPFSDPDVPKPYSTAMFVCGHLKSTCEATVFQPRVQGTQRLIALFAKMMAESPIRFTFPFSFHTTSPRLDAMWTRTAESASVLQIDMAGRPAAVSAMIAGLDSDGDAFTLNLLESVIQRLCPSAPREAGFAAVVKQRPLAVYNTFGQPTAVEEAMVGAVAAAAASAFFAVTLGNEPGERETERGAAR